MDKVEKSVWIAVDDNLELSEHVSISSALEAATLSVFFEKEGRRLNNGYSNYAYGVEFYNKAGLKVDGIIINDWRLFNVRVYSFSDYVQEKIECSVMDPYGETQTRTYGNRRAGILTALISLRNVSKFKNWTEYRKENPDEKELSEIQLLKIQVDQLKAENEQISSKLNAIQEIMGRNE